MRIPVAIDLTWVRHNKVGGTESNIRNLLKGLSNCDDETFSFFLLVTEDNKESFINFSNSSNLKLLNTGIESDNQKKRVLWQNLHLGHLLRKRQIHILLEPVYGLPFIGLHGIKTFTIIHDLQALHFPEYFSKGRVEWMKMSWNNAVKKSYKILAISNFVRKDIIDNYHCTSEKIDVLYDSVDIDQNDCAPQNELKKYGIEFGNYYYTVSSLFPHKNLRTIILAMEKLKKTNAFRKLVISGIGAGERRHELENLIKEKKLENDIVFTKFVDNRERNLLYKSCKAFLFPSVFEGFGMPPVEAMAFGVPVLTTKATSIPEVTRGLCNYVEEPKNSDEWVEKICRGLTVASAENVRQLLDEYNNINIANKLISLLKQ